MFASSESAGIGPSILLSGSRPLGGYMGKKLYVGNLPFSATDQVLLDTFAQCGTVDSAKIITDRDTGRRKGFGFVVLSKDEQASEANNQFMGTDLIGLNVVVSEEPPMKIM